MERSFLVVEDFERLLFFAVGFEGERGGAEGDGSGSRTSRLGFWTTCDEKRVEGRGLGVGWRCLAGRPSKISELFSGRGGRSNRLTSRC